MPAPVVQRDSRSPRSYHHHRTSTTTTAQTIMSATSTLVGEPDILETKPTGLEKQTEDFEAPKQESKNAYANYIDLEAQQQQPPRSRISRAWHAIRYTILDIYRRLFTLVFLANIGVFIYVMISQRKLMALINAAAANVLACGLARQPLVVNTIFVVVCSMPRSWPLRLRRIASKVYHYGGVHSGCGIASLVWYIGFVGVLTRTYINTDTLTKTPIIIAYIILALLLMIVIVAYPAFRVKLHDWFELTHRFTGWLVVALFVTLLMVFSHEASAAQGQSLGRFIIELPAFWFLMVTVVSIVHPWVFLRKVRVQPERLSTHAIRLHLDHTTTSFGKGIQLARHPLRDWHGFATFPDPTPFSAPASTSTSTSGSGSDSDLEKGLPVSTSITAGGQSNSDKKTFSCLVSKAGDWTSACINNPPTHLWKRGVLLYGFAYAMKVYKRLIIVTTGSGIGPCLSFLGLDGADRPAMRVVWQTRAPKRTYGDGVLELVSRMDADPVIIDTNSSGRVDMVPLVGKLYEEFDAEAVCVISNPRVTKQVVFDLECRGVPAFGPIFDS